MSMEGIRSKFSVHIAGNLVEATQWEDGTSKIAEIECSSVGRSQPVYVGRYPEKATGSEDASSSLAALFRLHLNQTVTLSHCCRVKRAEGSSPS